MQIAMEQKQIIVPNIHNRALNSLVLCCMKYNQHRYIAFISIKLTSIELIKLVEYVTMFVM